MYSPWNRGREAETEPSQPFPTRNIPEATRSRQASYARSLLSQQSQAGWAWPKPRRLTQSTIQWNRNKDHVLTFLRIAEYPGPSGRDIFFTVIHASALSISHQRTNVQTVTQNWKQISTFLWAKIDPLLPALYIYHHRRNDLAEPPTLIPRSYSFVWASENGVYLSEDSVMPPGTYCWPRCRFYPHHSKNTTRYSKADTGHIIYVLVNRFLGMLHLPTESYKVCLYPSVWFTFTSRNHLSSLK